MKKEDIERIVNDKFEKHYLDKNYINDLKLEVHAEDQNELIAGLYFMIIKDMRKLLTEILTEVIDID